jgi:hypothetical protein
VVFGLPVPTVAMLIAADIFHVRCLLAAHHSVLAHSNTLWQLQQGNLPNAVVLSNLVLKTVMSFQTGQAWDHINIKQD